MNQYEISPVSGDIFILRGNTKHVIIKKILKIYMEEYTCYEMRQMYLRKVIFCDTMQKNWIHYR